MIKQKWLAGMIGVLMAGSSYAADSALTLSATASYFEGRYGEPTTTKVWYAPVSVLYKVDALKLKLTTSYITVESQGAVISGGQVVGGGGASTTTRNSGMGDTWLEARYAVMRTQAGNELVPYAKYKFDTAENRLGSGENDYEAGLMANLVATSSVYPFAQAGYRVVGSPAGKNYNNIWIYSAGSTFKVAKDHYLTAMYSRRQAQQAGFVGASDLILSWNANLTQATGAQVFFDKGLSNGSPDFGVGVGVNHRF